MGFFLFEQPWNGLKFSEKENYLMTDNMIKTLIDENFDDGILNQEGWTYAYDVSETNGYLFLNQSTTDKRSSATFTFEDSVYSPTIQMDMFNHDSNNRFMGETSLRITAQDGTEFEANFRMQRNPYITNVNGDPANYDRPLVKIIAPGMETEWYFSDSVFTSDYLDKWTNVSISLDSEAGKLIIDLDGTPVFEIENDLFVGAKLDSLYFNSYGWWTGHYVKIDDLKVEGRTSLEPETPVSTGFEMPVGDRDGLVVTEARQSEDGWLDKWYNAADFGEPHPDGYNADHLGEDWNGELLHQNDAGQPVYAVSIGKVVYVGEYFGASGPSAGLGQTVVIEHRLPDGQMVYSLYAHLEEGSIKVTQGQVISDEGFQIAEIGSTGFSPSPHLHFEMFSLEGVTGSFVDTPWELAMIEFGYVNADIPSGSTSYTANYENGSVTWYDPSYFIQSGTGFDIDDPDYIPPTNGGQSIAGGSGNDDIFGGNGSDIISGGQGNDVLSGDNGNDLILGGTGSDYIAGGNGADELLGGDGADQIDGGKGADTIEGGAGNDIAIGGKGIDTFVFNPDQSGTDRLLDFVTNTANPFEADIIDVSNILLNGNTYNPDTSDITDFVMLEFNEAAGTTELSVSATGDGNFTQIAELYGVTAGEGVSVELESGVVSVLEVMDTLA